MDDRLEKQIAFIGEIDRLKQVERRNFLKDGSRRENSAEHSWFLAMMALVLGEWANEPGLDAAKVVRMTLVHDLVEIDAGDTFLYDEAGQKEKAAKESLAAQRIFGLLPEDQGRPLMALWVEFEQGQTAEAKFARGLDRLAPVYLNFHNQGRLWRENGIPPEQVRAHNRHMAEGSRQLWSFADGLLAEAERRGYFTPAADQAG